MEQEVLIHTVGNDVCYTKQQKNDHRGHDARKGDVNGSLKVACAVNSRCLVKFLINAGNRSNIDNGVPAQTFPYAQAGLEQINAVSVGKKILLGAKTGKNAVNGTFGGKESPHQTINDDPADKMRQRGHGLYDFAVMIVLDFVEHDRKDRRQEQQGVLDAGENHRVLKSTEKCRVGKHSLEVSQTHEVAVHDRRADTIFNKSKIPAHQRDVSECKNIDH